MICGFCFLCWLTFCGLMAFLVWLEHEERTQLSAPSQTRPADEGEDP